MKMRSLKLQEQQILKIIQQDEKTLTKFVSDKENAQTNKEQAERQILGNKTKLSVILSEIHSLQPEFAVDTGNNKLNFLEEMHGKKQFEYKQISSLVLKAKESERALIKMQDKDIPLLQQARQTAEKSRNEAEINHKLSEQQVDNFSKQTAEAEKKFREKMPDCYKSLLVMAQLTSNC